MPQQYLSTDPNAGLEQAAPPKYLSTDPEAGEPVEVRSKAARFGESFVRNVLPSTRAADYVEGPMYAAQHPVDSISLVLKALWDAHAGQASKTVEAGKRIITAPNLQQQLMAVDETLGHGLATVVPMIGPAAANAGEQIASGDVAGGLGATAGLLAPSGVTALRGTAPAKWAAGKVKASAIGNVEKAINPTRVDTKVKTARIAEEMLDRRVKATSLPKLEELATTKSSAAGQVVDAALEPHVTKTTDTMAIVDELEQAKKPYIGQAEDGRAVVNDPARVKQIEKLQDKLMEYGDQISVGSMRKLRQNWDRIVERGKGFVTEKTADKAWAAREGRTALRDELSKAVPNLDKVNAEYSFWQTLEDVTHASNERKTGQKGNLVSTVAEVGGMVVGAKSGVLQAMLGAKIAGSFKKFVNSPGYQLWTGVQKARLADALMDRNPARVQGLIHQGMVATARTSRAAGRVQSGRVPQAADATDREPSPPRSARGTRQ